MESLLWQKTHYCMTKWQCQCNCLMEGWTWHKYRNQLEDVTLHSSVHKFSSAQVVVPVEYVNEEVAEGKDHPVKYKLYFLLRRWHSDREIRSILETELSGSSGSVMARVIHLQHTKYDSKEKYLSEVTPLTSYTDTQPCPPQSWTVCCH